MFNISFTRHCLLIKFQNAPRISRRDSPIIPFKKRPYITPSRDCRHKHIYFESRVELANTSNESFSKEPVKVSAFKKLDSKKQNQLYEQLNESRNRLSKTLSETNKYLSFIEHKLEDSSTAVQDAYDCLLKILSEFDTLSRLTNSTVAAIQFGVDPDDAIAKLDALKQRVQLAKEAVEEKKDLILDRVPRSVKVSWFGLAQEVRILGDFDRWTRGKELSSEEITANMESEFTAELKLLPGSYQVKFCVDGNWKLSEDWPTVTNDDGSENNLIIVE